VHGLLVLEIEVQQRVDQVVHRRLQRRVEDAAARQNFQDVGNRLREDVGAGGVVMRDVEEQLERLRKSGVILWPRSFP
jgi:Fe-S cluster assembly scaffold protein SufB